MGRRPAGPGQAFFAPCDLADLTATRQLITDLAARQGGLDVLINNAAIYPRKEVGDYTTEDWLAVQRVNVDAAFVCAQAALPAMRAAGSGRIINVSSITFFGRTPFLVPYVASKGALVGLTRALARELGAHGITVNAIAPGAFPTAAEAIHPGPGVLQRVHPGAAGRQAARDARRHRQRGAVPGRPGDVLHHRAAAGGGRRLGDERLGRTKGVPRR